MKKTNSQKPPEIITHLARHLSHILAEYLSNPDLGNKRHPLKDRLAVKLMLTLSQTKLYREELLYRDYNQQHEVWVDFVLPGGGIQKLHTESIFYVEAVLGKRLQLVAKHKSFPTNLHFLLMMLCRYSVEVQWLRTWVKRKRDCTAETHDIFFGRAAKILQSQTRSVTQESAITKNLRERFGDLYLSVGHNRAAILAEMTLFQVVEAVPTQLNPAIKALPAWYPALLERILLSLNESYGLLRSCGLPPQEFWDEMSIGNLRELKKLKALAEKYLQSGAKKNRYDAYEQAFTDILNGKNTANAQDQTAKDKQGKVAGFENFLEFAGSKVGVCMLRIFPESLDTEDGEDPKPEPTASSENLSEESKQRLKDFLQVYDACFTPAVRYYYEQSLIENRPPNGPDSFLQDAECIRLVAAEKKYASLDNEQLQTQLFQAMVAILKKKNFQDWLDN